MKNSIRLVKQEEIYETKQYFIERGETGLLVELHGKELRTWQQYAVEIGKQFKFPAMYQESHKEHIVDAYLDWIRDLSWFEGIEEFAIVIYDYNQFLRDEKGKVRNGNYCEYIINKEMIISGFVDTILPWWEYDVAQCSVDGKIKPFNVYLIA